MPEKVQAEVKPQGNKSKILTPYKTQEAKESFASPDQRFGMKTEVYFVSLRQ